MVVSRSVSLPNVRYTFFCSRRTFELPCGITKGGANLDIDCHLLPPGRCLPDVHVAHYPISILTLAQADGMPSYSSRTLSSVKLLASLPSIVTLVILSPFSTLT